MLLVPLQDAEDWLYDEGEDCTKSVYIAKLDELKKLGNPVEARFHEQQTRGPAADALRATCESYLTFARSDAPQYAHITAEERATVTKEAEAALAWLSKCGAPVSRCTCYHLALMRLVPPVFA